ncbi:MAG: helix-turn-helix transcriptional regulator [Lachnospiraceae bacterium]|nr:helix-turn-helix transcriptional regulator [Lachnospiraceae bacterium]
MTVPISPGYNFKLNHKKKDNHFSSHVTMYGDLYGIGFMVSASRRIVTPTKTVIVHPGTVQFMHKSLPHRTTYISEGVYENIEIKFRECVAERILAIVGREKFDMLFEEISITLTPEAITQIQEITARIEQEWEHFDEYSEVIIEGLVIQFFVTALRGQSAPPAMDTARKENHQPLIDAISYVQHHYAQDPSLQETADAVHVSSAHLSRLFRSDLETTYSQFLTEVKLSHAMSLLLNSRLPISEVANQCGYQNSNYFCDAFKKVMGVSPLKFKKSRKGQETL